MQAMYIFADHEEEPRSKKLREKLVEYFKDRKNRYLFLTGGFAIVALLGTVVGIEEFLRGIKNEVEKKMYKKYLEVKDEIKNEVDKTKDEVRETIKDEIGKTRDEIKKSVSQKKVEYTILSIFNDVLYKVLKYIFVILVLCLVYFLYYKYGRKTR